MQCSYRQPTALAMTAQLMQELEQRVFEKWSQRFQDQRTKDRKRGRKKRAGKVKITSVLKNEQTDRSQVTLMRGEKGKIQFVCDDMDLHKALLPFKTAWAKQSCLRLCPQVLAACIELMQHDYKYSLILDIKGRPVKGAFAAVGLHLDGSMRQCRRIIKAMGMNEDSPVLAKKVMCIVKLLMKCETRIKGRVEGKIFEAGQGVVRLTGEQLNKQTRGEDVRGGNWAYIKINAQLMEECNRRFMVHDERCWELTTSGFNLYQNLNAARHYKYDVTKGQMPKVVYLNRNELIERSGIAQLTQHTRYREYKSLEKALNHMVELGILEDWRSIDGRYLNLEVIFANPPDI